MAARFCALVLAPCVLACGAAPVASPTPPAGPDAATPVHPADAAPPAASGTVATATLLDRIGGRRVLASVVDELMVDVFADNRINKFFESTRRDPARTKTLHDALVVLLCSRAGGTDCGAPPSRSLTDAHAGMPIAPAHVEAFLEDVRIALAVNHVAEPLRDELIASLGDAKFQIVKDPAK